MDVHFWGTRGSLPTPLQGHQIRRKIRHALTRAVERSLNNIGEIDQFIDKELGFATKNTYGGNTPCVEIRHGNRNSHILCDLGSGAREFGNHILANHGPGKPRHYAIFMSHVHWDHIMGFPFFTPAYIPGNKVTIYGCHDILEQAFRAQHSAPSFPVPFSALGADISFVQLSPDRDYDIDGVSVRAMLQYHEGDSYGYRFTHQGKSVVYSTDSEHKLESPQQTARFVDFFSDADLVIFDAMYSLAEAISVKEDWGHASNIVGVDICLSAAVKHYCLFHHEPLYDDDMIHTILSETRRYKELSDPDAAMAISSAYDGLTIHL